MELIKDRGRGCRGKSEAPALRCLVAEGDRFEMGVRGSDHGRSRQEAGRR